MAKRKTPDDYHALAQSRGYQWLGPQPKTARQKTRWQCPHGHQWEASYSHIQQGTGCPKCSSNAPKTPDDYHALAQSRGFRWLGPQVPNAVTKTWWQCSHGHRWHAHYSSIHTGSGCPVCAGNSPKTPDDYHALAQSRGFRWLGPPVPNIRTKTWWQCPHGHRWQTRYNSIQSGTGCPTCARSKKRLTGASTRRKTPSDYHALAKSRGFLWCGPEVPNVRTKTWWQCPHGHRWQTRYNHIQSGHGCPTCRKKSK